MAQSEHDSDASSVLISTSDEITENVKTIISTEVSSLDRSSIIEESINSNGLFIKIKDLSEAKEIINKLAPEHLHIAFDHQDYEYEEDLIAGLILREGTRRILSLTMSWVRAIYYLQTLLLGLVHLCQ